MEELERLEGSLTGPDSVGRLNDIKGLYDFCESPELRIVAEALKALARVLSHHRGRVLATATAEGSGATGDAVLVGWLQQHQEAYYATLSQLATSDRPRAQVCAVRLALASIRDEAKEAAGPSRGDFAAVPPEKRIQNLLTELLLGLRWGDQAATCLMDEFAKEFADVRHYVLSHLRFCCTQLGKCDWSSENPAEEPATKKRKETVEAHFTKTMRRRGLVQSDVFTRALALLREAPEPLPSGDKQSLGAGTGAGVDEETPEVAILAPTGRPVGFFLREYRKLFQDAWLQLLGLRTPLDQCAAILQFLPTHVIPHLSQPLLLADFYLRGFHSGSTEVCVLSLSGLLLLLTRYGLGDPDTLSTSCSEFFAQLYSLVKLETFALRTRARFQRLLGAALSSNLLPARFAAAFAKKCMRTAIFATEPGTVMWLIAIAYTLIQKHHSHCAQLLHSPSSKEDASQTPSLEDPFDMDATLSNAVDAVATTSLWELQLLLRHQVPAIATLAKLFLRPFFKPTARKLDPELFLDQTTRKMYKQALKSGERQMEKWKTRGQKRPLAFEVEDDEESNRIAVWAGVLSTTQRQIGAGI